MTSLTCVSAFQTRDWNELTQFQVERLHSGPEGVDRMDSSRQARRYTQELSVCPHVISSTDLKVFRISATNLAYGRGLRVM